MFLFLDTTQPNRIVLFLFDENKIIAKINQKTFHRKSEQLLFLLDKALKENRKKVKDIKGIAVMNKNGSFSDTRLGIIEANTLAWSLAIPVIDILPQGIAIFESSFSSAGYCEHLRKIVFQKIKKVKIGRLIKPIYAKEPNIVLTS